MLKQNLTNLYGQLEGCRILLVFDVTQKRIVEFSGQIDVTKDPTVLQQRLGMVIKELINFMVANPSRLMKADYLAFETDEDIYYITLSDSQNLALIANIDRSKTRLPIVRTLITRSKDNILAIASNAGGFN